MLKNPDLSRMDERDVFLRELTHRTANTLQRIIAALHFARRGNSLLLETATRQVGGAARVHALLAGGDSGIVDTALFFKELCEALEQGWLSGSKILIEKDFPSLFMTVADARRVAMIVFELISNAIEHAFPERAGRVAIAVRDDTKQTHILIEDDGVCYGWSRPDGQGAGIVDALVGILNGNIARSITAGGSLRVNLTFPSFNILVHDVAGAS